MTLEINKLCKFEKIIFTLVQHIAFARIKHLIVSSLLTRNQDVVISGFKEGL